MQNTSPSGAATGLASVFCTRIGPQIIRSLVNHNPLYLISACFVLHGTSQLLPGSIDQSSAYNPLPLLGLSCGYLVLLAITAVAIVRLGKVWEDARSILLIIAGLLVELSLALDAPLTQNLSRGRILVLLGFLFAILVAEGLIRGLRVRVPILFRLPLHGMLALVFLYPLLLARAPDQPSLLNVSWGVYLFSPTAGLILLTLVPAIRRGPNYVQENGSPWSWPSFPWTLFVVLLMGICLRGYVLSLSFDPVLSLGYAEAMQLQTAYAPYFLVPILVSIALLLLEHELVTRSEKLQRLAMAIPFACIALSFPSRHPSVPAAEFLLSFVEQIGSPVLVGVIAALLFYLIALFRKVQFAEAAFVFALLVASMVGPGTISLDTMIGPNPVLLGLLCVFQLWRGIRTRSSLRTVVGVACGIVVLRVGPLAGPPEFVREFTWLHLGLMATLVVGMVFEDRVAWWLRKLGGLLLFVACVAALNPPPDLPTQSPDWTIASYMCFMIGLSLACAYLSKDIVFVCSASFSLAAGSVVLASRFYLHLKDLPEWPGIRSFAVGFAILAIAALISAIKGGMIRKLTPLWPRHSGSLGARTGPP